MNRKKRAIALGLAAAQLAAFAPMYSQVAFAAETKITVDGEEYTVKLPDACTGYSVAAAADDETNPTAIVVTVTVSSGYKAGDTAPSSSGNSTVSFTETKNGDGATTGWTATITPTSGISYDFGDLTVSVLEEITPTIALPSGTTEVDVDKTEAEDTNHAAAIAAAEALAYEVTGVTLKDNTELTKGTDYSITCAWDDTTNNVKVTLAFSTGADKNYSVAAGATTEIHVPVTYKAAAKALTFAVDDTINMGEQTTEPNESDMIAAIKEKVKISVDGTESTTLVENTDYTLTIEKDASDTDTTDGQQFTVTLASKKADEYAVADGDKTKTVNVTYTVAAAKTNITAAIAAISFDDELDAAPTADEVKAKITAVTFAIKTDSTSVTDLALGTDYDVNVTLDDSDPDSLVYKAAIALKNTDNAKKYAFDGTDNEVTLTVSYTLKSEAAVSLSTSGVTAANGGTLTDQLEVTLVDADGGDLTGGSAKVKEGAALTLTVKPKTGFAFKSDSALNVSAALTTDSSTTITPTDNGNGVYTITVPALDADDTLTISLTGALEVKTVSVTDFEFGYGSGKTAYEVDYKTALSDTDIKSALELTSITTADGKITDATELAKFDLSVTFDSTAGTAKVTITSKDSAYVIEAGLEAKDVAILKTITMSSTDVLATNPSHTVAAATETLDTVKTAVKGSVTDTVNALTATSGTYEDIASVLEFEIGDVTEDNGAYKIAVTPKLKSGAEGYKLVATTPFEYTVTITKLSVTPDTVTLTDTTASAVTLATNKAGTTEDAVKTAVLAAIKAPTFKDASSNAVTLTETTHYTVEVSAVDKDAKTATVTVKPVADSLVTFTAEDTSITIAYTATEVGAPTTTADASNKITIAKNASAADIEKLVKNTITIPDSVPESNFNVTVDSSAFTAAADNADSTITVKYAIADADNYAWKSDAGADGSGVVSVTVNVIKGAALPVLTPTLTAGDPLYIKGALTADSIKAALTSDVVSAAFTKTPDGGTAETFTPDAGDYEYTVTYTSGATASVGLALTDTGLTKYVLPDVVNSATITVKRAYDLPSATTATITDPFANGTSAADIKTAVEAKVATLFTTAADYTITSAAPTTADGEQTVDVTVTLKDTNGVFDNTAHNATITVTVTYTVSAATPAGNAVTVSAATNGTVTADKTTAASGDTVTLTIAPASGYKLDALTITGASGTVTPTKVNDTTYTFEMPAEAVTVSATFVDASAQTQSAPAAPTMKTRTNTSVTLNTIAANANGAAAEYSKDGTTWQTSPTFSGLTKNTSYTFYARYAAVEGFTASPASVGTTIKTTNTSSGGSSSGGGHSSGGSSGSSSGSKPADSSSKTTPHITNNTADDIDEVVETKPTAANLSKITDTAEDVEKALNDISEPTVVEKQAATVLEAAIKAAKNAKAAADKATCAENIQLIMKALSTKAPKVLGDADNSGKVDSDDVLLSVLNFRKYRTNAAGQLYTAVVMGITNKTAINTNDILAFIKAFRTR